MKFFLDNCLSPHLGRALSHLSGYDGHSVHHLREKFSANARDVDWLTDLGRDGNWVVISGDTRISRRPHERQIWADSKLTAFFMSRGWTEQTYWEQAWRLIRWWPEIVRMAARHPSAAGFEVKWQQSPTPRNLVRII